MISYRQWKLLNESLGRVTLGLSKKQNLGITGSQVSEMGLPMPPKKKPMFGQDGPPMDDEEMSDEEMGDEEMGDMDDMGDPSMGDEEMGDMDDMGGEEDAIDPDAEFEDDEEEDEDEEDEEGMPHKFPMGMPHNAGPFMKFARRMKEGCGDDVESDDSEGGDEIVDKKGDKELSFLQKKQKKKMASGEKKINKKCDSGMDDMPGKKCKKCAKQKKMKEAQQYKRPVSYDGSEEAFEKSMKNMFGNPHQRFSDGMRDFSEDMLIQQEPKPGDVGYAPQTRVGSDVNSMAESIQHLMKKIAELEKQAGK